MTSLPEPAVTVRVPCAGVLLRDVDGVEADAEGGIDVAARELPIISRGL